MTRVERECPFCGCSDEFTTGRSQRTTQYSHSSTIRYDDICDGCGYERTKFLHGNARRTSTQPWRHGKTIEKMPEDRCLVICSECDDILGGTEIGTPVEIDPDSHVSDCCRESVWIAYTFADAPDSRAKDEPNYCDVAVRQLRPHVGRKVDCVVARPRAAFECDPNFEIRVGDEVVELRRPGLHGAFRIDDAEVISAKLSRNPGLESVGDGCECPAKPT